MLEAGADEMKFPGLLRGLCLGCPRDRPTPNKCNGFQTPAALLRQRHRVPEDYPELWPLASLQRLLVAEHQSQYGNWLYGKAVHRERCFVSRSCDHMPNDVGAGKQV